MGNKEIRYGYTGIWVKQRGYSVWEATFRISAMYDTGPKRMEDTRFNFWLTQNPANLSYTRYDQANYCNPHQSLRVLVLQLE